MRFHGWYHSPKDMEEKEEADILRSISLIGVFSTWINGATHTSWNMASLDKDSGALLE